MQDKTWTTASFPTPLIFRYHLPLIQYFEVKTIALYLSSENMVSVSMSSLRSHMMRE